MNFQRPDRYRNRIEIGVVKHAFSKQHPVPRDWRPGWNGGYYARGLVANKPGNFKSMCLIALAWNTRPDLPLLVIANRDEFYERDTQPLHWWKDHPNICAGRDLVAKGTWMGVSRSGRFAAVTNYRQAQPAVGLRSRGELVTDFLNSETDPAEWASILFRQRDQYAGFNLLAGIIGEELIYLGNRIGEWSVVAPGVHAISNGTLNDGWPKVTGLRADLERLAGADIDAHAPPLFELLSDTSHARDEHLPDTGVGIAMERVLSARKIVSPGYGTRSSTVIRVDGEHNVDMIERTLDEYGHPGAQHSERFRLTPPAA